MTIIGIPGGQVGAPNDPAAQPGGQVGAPNDPAAQPGGQVGAPNQFTALEPAELPRSITPLLTLNFSSGTYAKGRDSVSLGQIGTFTRASSGSFVNRRQDSLGQWEYFVDTVGADTLRIEYDPATGRSLGAIFEPGATNLLLDSGDYTLSMSQSITATVTPNFSTSPDGLQNANKIETTTGDNGSRVQKSASVTEGVQYTLSQYLKAGTLEEVTIVLFDKNFIFNLATGEVTSETNNPVYETDYAGNGWWRLSITGVPNTTGVTPFQLGRMRAGVAGDYVLGWGSQLEELEGASSYIATGGSPVTRLSDRLSIPQSDAVRQGEHTFFTAGVKVPPGAPTAPRVLFGNGLGSDDTYVSSARGDSLMLYKHGAQSISPPNDTKGFTRDYAFTYDTANMKIYNDGVRIANQERFGAVLNESRTEFNVGGAGAETGFFRIKSFISYNLALTEEGVSQL